MKKTVRVAIRKPRTQKSRFKLRLDITNSKGIRKQSTLDLPEIDSINKSYLAGRLTTNEALDRLEAVKARYLKEHHNIQTLSYSKENKKIIDAYFREEYSFRGIKEITKKSAMLELERIITILGDISLTSSSREEITGAINSCNTYSKETIRSLIHKLNNLLIFCRRGFKVPKPRAVISKINYINEAQLKTLASHLPEVERAWLRVFFYTGMRTGELFGLEERSVSFEREIIKIDQQLLRDGEIDIPKAGKKRSIPLNKEIESDLEIVLNSKKPDRHNLYKLIKRTSKEVLDKEISIHDLRRSFAIHCLRVYQFSLTEVAMLLGDSFKVVQSNYSGFTFDDEGVATLLKKMNR